MRIKSPFKDYYDSLQAYDQDRETLYIRQTKKVILTRFDKYTIGGDLIYGPYHKQFVLHRVLLGTAGQIVKGFRLRLKDGFKPEYQYYWGFNTTLPVLKLNFDEKTAKEMHNYKWGSAFSNQDESVYLDIFKEYNCVNFFIHSQNVLVIEPKLSDLQFQKHTQLHDMYQNIVVYLSNRNVGDIKIPEIPNDIKIEQAGFDKFSFRKAKKKK